MGNFSLEFSETNYQCNNKDERSGEKDEIIVSGHSKVTNCDIYRHHAQGTDFPTKCGNKQIRDLPPKPPATKKMNIGNSKRANDTNNKYNGEVTEKPKTRNFFRRNRSNSLDVLKDNKSSSKLDNNEFHRQSQYDNKVCGSSNVQNQVSGSSFKKSFINGLLSPRIARHLPFSSSRSSIKSDRSRTPSRSRNYETASCKLPTHRENSTVSINTRDSCDTSRLLNMSPLDNLTSCSSVQSLSSVDSQQSGLYSQNSVPHQRYPKYLRERYSFDDINKSYVNLRRDPTIFGPRRTSNGRNNQQHFNSNLFLNINQGKHHYKLLLNKNTYCKA